MHCCRNGRHLVRNDDDLQARIIILLKSNLSEIELLRELQHSQTYAVAVMHMLAHARLALQGILQVDLISTLQRVPDLFDMPADGAQLTAQERGVDVLHLSHVHPSTI